MKQSCFQTKLDWMWLQKNWIQNYFLTK